MFAEGYPNFGDWLLPFSQRLALRKPGAPSAAYGLETKTTAVKIYCFRPIVLGNIATSLEWVEASDDSRAAGDRCALAP
jgi:hypothetical protein